MKIPFIPRSRSVDTRLALVANVPDKNIIIPENGAPLEDLLLSLPYEENIYQEADDISTVLQSISITENKNSLPPIQLFQRTGKLQVSLHLIPEKVSDLNLELSCIPSSISFSGSATNTFGIITKPFDAQGQATIRTFPTKKGEAALSITYHQGNTLKRKIIPFSEAIDTNQVVHVDCNFPELSEGGLQGNPGKIFYRTEILSSGVIRQRNPTTGIFIKTAKTA